MNFADVWGMTIPDGSVTRLSHGSIILWEKPYMEIRPTLVWLSPNAMNDVLSNTNWNIT